MLVVHKSPTADTRTCDYASVGVAELFRASEQHITDVRAALEFFRALIAQAAERHDADKLTDIAGFYADFSTGFAQTTWWDRHRRLNRHHLTQQDGIPGDVNLVDVLDFLADCVMAGMARSGRVYPLQCAPELLERAFQNTVALLQQHIVLAPDDTRVAPAGTSAHAAGDQPLSTE